MSNNTTKYVILLGDGMADYPIDEIDGKTPLEHAYTPNMDHLAQNGLFGLVQTVPEGMAPGSDTANLSIFGYDPRKYYTGRAPLEALNLGIELGPKDVAFRCNIVTIENETMCDFTAHHIVSEFSEIIINELNQKTNHDDIEFHTGVSYRNIMIWRNFPFESVPVTTPPHDIQDQLVTSHLPQNDGARQLVDLMQQARLIIADSDTIQNAKAKFKGTPSAIWLWGGGRKPMVDSLEKKYGLHGYTISAVDLIHGIGKAAGLSSLPVEGATGYIDTDYSGKADALLKGLESANFIYLHVESPDESGHEGNLKHKLQAIEDFDKLVVGPVIEGMKKYDDHVIMLLPDHATPIAVKTHTSDPVPFCIYKCNSGRAAQKQSCFNEKNAKESGIFIDKGHELIALMISEKS